MLVQIEHFPSQIQLSQKPVDISLEKKSQEIFVCQVCFHDVSISDEVIFDRETHCICQKCFKKYLEVNIQEGKVFNLQCPHCAKKLSFNFFKTILDQSTLNKFKYFIRSKLVDADPLMRWCPNTKCRLSFVLPKNFKRKTECPTCKSILCTECNREYHNGSCKSIFEDEINQWEKHDNIQSCSFCKAVISKNEGCNHMTCSVCQNQWCWVCGGNWEFHDVFNPFGCDFLPFAEQSSTSSEKAVRYFLKFLAILFGIPIVLVIGVPLFIIFNESDAPECMQEHKSLFILAVIGSVIIQPIFDIIAICVFFPALFFGYFIMSRKMKKKQNKILTENRELIRLGINRNDLSEA